MAARGEDTLTQIQKYKAMLSSKRNKGDEKAIRKPKKKRLRKGNVETGLETVLTVPGLTETNNKENPSKSQEENLKEENVDSTKLETSTVLLQESKQCSELQNDGELVEPKSTITSNGEQEPKDKENEPVDNRPSTCDKMEGVEKKEKSKGLSLRRKRKKSKKKHKEAEDKAQTVENEGETEENLEEKFSCKESAPKLGEVSVAPLSPETKQDESLCNLVSPGQELEENEGSGNENSPKEGAEGKEKISRAQKFKRWASFTKQKKTNDSVVIENESFDLENPKPTKSSIQNPESFDNGTTERHLLNESLPGEKVEDMENSLKDEAVNEHEDLECPPLPEKQRRRSVSLDETTDKENNCLSPDSTQRTRSASFGKGNILSSLTASLRREKTRKKSQDKDVSVEQDNEKAGNQHEDEISEPVIEACAMNIQNNEDVNEVENELEQKTKTSIVDDEEEQINVKATGDDKKEPQNIESPVKDEQPKKKKKSFLRKISSNLKASKKDETTESKKIEISAPLLVKFESLTGSEILNNSRPIEVSPEKPNKRKKSGINIKLPKALKRVKSTEYEAIGGAEAEKEIETDEKFAQNNLEKSEEVEKEDEQSQEEGTENLESVEKVQESVESDKIAGIEVGKSDYCKEENKDGETYSFCRALMNDVLKELVDRMTKTEQDDNPSEENNVLRGTNDMSTSIAEEMKTIEEDKEVNDEIKEEREKYSEELKHHLDDIPGENEEMVEGKSSELTTSAKEEDKKHLEKRKENNEHDITEQEKNEDKREYQDIENSSHETEEKIVQKPKQHEGEPNKFEEEPQPEDITTRSEEEEKQPEEMTPRLESEPNHLEEKPQPEVMTTRSGDEEKQPDEIVPTRPAPEGEPKESDDTLQREQDNPVLKQNESQPSEASFEKSTNELQPDDDKAMASEGTSNLYKNEVSVLERSIEVSMKTKALVDSYILIDHSLQLSQEFLKQVELMDMNYSNKRKPFCTIM